MDQTAQGIDTPLKIVNQAAYGVWYGQLQADKWRFILVLIYSAVNDLGRQLCEFATYTLLQTGELKVETGINSFLFQTNKLSLAAQTAVFTDAIYGLNNVDNYAKWGALNPGADDTKMLLFEMELKTYFAFTDDQITELKTNW